MIVSPDRSVIITKGVGEGPSKLAAFDKALYKAGIANKNIIYLSSIIPENVNVKVYRPNFISDRYGDKLYAVVARHDQEFIGKEAWAGLGWVQNERRQGVFVEHHGEDKNWVESLIKNSLKSLIEYRSGNFGKFHICLAGVRCRKNPVTALVAAVYSIESW